MRQTDILILGQGLVGTLLSYRLSRRGAAHVVVDRGLERGSTLAAAGIVNPVTGRRFVPAWRAGELLGRLGIYRELAATLGVPLVHDLVIYRDLEAPAALNLWDLRRGAPDVAPFMAAPRAGAATGFAGAPTRVGPTVGGARVDLPLALKRYRALLAQRGWLVVAELSADALVAEGGRWTGAGVSAKVVVDCTGASAMGTARWGGLPWRGTKGEAVRFALPDLPRGVAYKRQAFVCPVGHEREVWVGATNQDHYDELGPSATGRAFLREQAASFGVELPAGANFLAGVRPTVRDRRPLVGEHPEAPGLWLCNGMGTKGTSLTPYATAQLVGALLDGQELDAELSLAGRWS